MSVMQKYVPRTSPLWERRLVPVPASSGLGQLPSLELFESAPEQLQMPYIGTYTEWATRTGDLSWSERPSAPETNLAVWALTDRQINMASDLGFGIPLPFVAIMTPQPLTRFSVDKMWEGTAFAPYETIAVYRQDDAKPVPTIRFIHWGERIDMADAPQHLRPVEAAAQSHDGQVIFVAQRPARDTTQRDFPAMSFEQALDAQLALDDPSGAAIAEMATAMQQDPNGVMTMSMTEPGVLPGTEPVSPTTPTMSDQNGSAAPVPFWQSSAAPILVGVGAAALVYWWATRETS